MPLMQRVNVPGGYVISRDDDGTGLLLAPGDTVTFPAASAALAGTVVVLKRNAAVGTATITGTFDGVSGLNLTALQARTVACGALPGGGFAWGIIGGIG